MSTRANHAKAAHGFRAALQCIQKIEAGLAADKARELHGLTAEQWARVAVLCSFLEALPHDEACALPLLVLPPNRLRLFNPVQALLYAVGPWRTRGDAAAARYPARFSRATGAAAFGLIAMAFLLVRPLHLPGTGMVGPLMPTTMALWLVGALVGVLGAGTTSRACGLLSVANGVLLLGLATGTGLCPAVGLGCGLNVLALALVLAERTLLGDTAPAVASQGS